MNRPEPPETVVATAIQASRPEIGPPAPEPGDAFDPPVSLSRRLQELVDRGSPDELALAFAEALLAWEGLSLHAYVSDRQGQQQLVAATPGLRRLPPVLAVWRYVPPGGPRVLGVVTSAELTRMGIDAERPVLAVELRSHRFDPWLLLFDEVFGQFDSARLQHHIDVFADALERMVTLRDLRMQWAVLQPLLEPGQREDAANMALAALEFGLPASGAALEIRGPAGTAVFSAGGDDAHSPVRPFGRQIRLEGTAPAAHGHAVTLAVKRGSGEFFTDRDQQALDKMAAVFAGWFTRLLGDRAGPDRRAAPRAFGHVLDHGAAQALRDGSDVSIMVIAAPSLVHQANQLQQWVANVRAQLRGSDLAGALSAYEIGVLLHGVTADHASAVVDRMRRCLGHDATEGGDAAIGMVTRRPGEPAGPSLVGAARAGAARQGAQWREAR